MLLYDFVNPYIIFMTIVLLFALCARAIFKNKEWINHHKRTIFLIIGILLAWSQIARYIGFFFDNDVTWNIWFLNFRIIGFNPLTHLPFYICRLSALVLLYYVITKDKRVESFLFYWGATGLAGVIYPNGDITNIATLTETFYIDHFVLGLTPFFLVVYQGYRPVKKDLLMITLLMLVILLLFIPINLLAGSDYFYTKDQSIFRIMFPHIPNEVFGFFPLSSVLFAVTHTAVAFGFFSLYYRYFTNKSY